MKEEEKNIILVDAFDNIVGTGTKTETHRKGLLHRAFSVFIINSAGEMLLQKRNADKYHSGGLWTNACCSHPVIGQNIDCCASERLYFEMGIKVEINEIGAFIYRHKFSDNLWEYEYDHVFVGYYDGDVFPHRDEASDFRWISLKALSEELTGSPQLYTPWFFVASSLIIRFLDLK